MDDIEADMRTQLPAKPEIKKAEETGAEHSCRERLIPPPELVLKTVNLCFYQYLCFYHPLNYLPTEKRFMGAREMAQQLRVCADLPEDPHSFPVPTQGWGFTSVFKLKAQGGPGIAGPCTRN